MSGNEVKRQSQPSVTMLSCRVVSEPHYVHRLAEVPNWDYDDLVRILSLPTLRAFYEQHEYADSKEPLLTWHGHVLKARWQTPADVKADFGTASILKEGRVVFNIAGNKYRLITSINYPYGIVFIKFIGTHKQYDAIDAQTI